MDENYNPKYEPYYTKVTKEKMFYSREEKLEILNAVLQLDDRDLNRGICIVIDEIADELYDNIDSFILPGIWWPHFTSKVREYDLEIDPDDAFVEIMANRRRKLLREFIEYIETND